MLDEIHEVYRTVLLRHVQDTSVVNNIMGEVTAIVGGDTVNFTFNEGEDEDEPGPPQETTVEQLETGIFMIAIQLWQQNAMHLGDEEGAQKTLDWLQGIADGIKAIIQDNQPGSTER